MGLIRPRAFVVVLLALLALALMLPGLAAAATTWTAEAPPVPDTWFGVSFPDVQHGWAVGSAGNIIVTTDGGATWSLQTTISGSLYECCFTDTTHGWAVGPAGAYATTDGSTWTPQTTMPFNYWEDVEMADATTGWIVGDDGQIYATTNGGDLWAAQTSGTPANLYDVCVRSADEAWIAGEGGVVLHTTDGGATWTEQVVDASQRFYCIGFSDQLHGWLGSAGGAIYATTDGGVTWTPQSSGTVYTLWRSSALLDGRVWMVGSAGVLFTDDGGVDWAAQDTGSGSIMWDCTFLSRGLGWVAGADVMLKYEEKYAVTVESGDKGTVSPGTTDVTAGEDQTFDFTPDAGYQVADVLVDGVSVGAPSSYTFEDVTETHTLGVAFEPLSDNHPTCVMRGWVRGWSNRVVRLHVTGVPGPYGTPVTTMGVALDGALWAPVHAAKVTIPVGAQGVTRVTWLAYDANGNASPVYHRAVRVDTMAPTVLAKAASGVAGGETRLRYRVDDAAPGCGFALVRLVVLDASGKVLTRSSTRQAPVNAWRTVRVSARSLAPGSYTVVLRAMDLAKNFQKDVTRTTLTVR